MSTPTPEPGYSNGGVLVPGRVGFHQHGHHVQKAHGRRPAKLASDGSHLNGSMIALLPTAEDAKRLAIKGGELPVDLHLTFYYLGSDAGAWSPDQRNELEADLRAIVLSAESGHASVLKASVFGAAHWNGDGEEPSWVWSVGDVPGGDPADNDGDGLEDVRSLVTYALENRHGPDAMPDQHTPWVAHICAAYSDDLSLLPEMEKRLGPVTFDRIRLTFGDDVRDIPLNTDASLTAAGQFRRRLTAVETASRADFALTDARWHSAVGAAVMMWTQVLSRQRMQIKKQVSAAVDQGDLSRLASLDVDTGHAYDVLLDHMQRYAEQCAQHQEEEARRQGVTVGPWSLTAAGGESSVVERLRSYARVKVAALASRLRSSASQRAVVLAQTGGSGDDVANEVDAEFSGSQQSYIGDELAAAMSAAQGLGRMAVLLQSPPGHYYASELLDNRTCKPCSSVDGQEFESLDAADQAYPAGGYVSCQGGGRCRGQLVTVWESSETASAAPQSGDDMTSTTDLGGKPNPGTKKDKRLKENDKPVAKATGGDEEHFGSTGGSVSDAAWDGSASRFSDEQYRNAAAGCDSGNGSPKQLCFLPHHEPGGATNRNGVHAAAQRVSSLSGHDPAAVARAKAHLRSHYKQLGEEPPDSVKATLGDEVELALAAPVESEGNPDAPETTAPWRGPLAVEGKVTGDGREFSPDSLTWADPPLSLRWNKEDSHGGEPHTVAVNVGRIDRVWREGSLIMGEGVLNLAEDDGQRAYDLVRGKFLKGVSIDADSITDADVEYVMPDSPDGEGDGEMDILDLLFMQPEKIVFHSGRIRAATLCDIPAFTEAYIELTGPEGAVVASAAPAAADVPVWAPPRPARRVDGLTAALAEPDWKPPAEWFSDPRLTVPTGITITDEGRVYGHAAMWGACHIGRDDVCVQAPHEEQHPYYMTGEVVTAEGGRVAVGQITVGTGHAPLNMGAMPAAEHYDHTGHAVADVAVGNDSHGIWVAGSIRAGADPLLVHELRAAGQVSGDWRRIGSSLRLVGLLAVNVPGFPVPKLQARVASGQQEALIAAGRPTVYHGKSEKEILQQAFQVMMDQMAREIHGGNAS